MTWPLEGEGKKSVQGKSLIRWIIMNAFQAGSDCWRTKLRVKTKLCFMVLNRVVSNKK